MRGDDLQPTKLCPHSIGVDAGEHDPTSCSLLADHTGPHIGYIDGYDHTLAKHLRASIVWEGKK